MYDALIVGAGPAGSHVAASLAGSRHSILVLEQHESIGKRACCTGIVGKECIDAFPVARRAVLREASSARFFAPSGQCLRVEKATPQAYILDRMAFDAEMAETARARGAEYLLRSRVISITNTEEACHARVQSNGQVRELEGKVVVIASGFGSRLTRELGLGRTRDFVMGAQAEVQAGGIDEVEIYFGRDRAPGFFAWLVPTSDGRALAGLLCRHHTGAYLKRFLADMAHRGRIASADVKITYGAIPLKPSSRTSSERVIVVGDAAGQVKPTTGGGIYFGLICAQAAAETIDEALRYGDVSAQALKRYDSRWRERLSGEIRTGRWGRWAFERLNDRQIEYLFDTARSRHIPEALLTSSDFSFDAHRRLITKGARRLGLGSVISLLWLALDGWWHPSSVPKG
ncbi:MAG: NAD(P)/FAD-dependent oxidoreductase [Chloroflexi bacterium]|nr:NAD(P)/FAD-dependent oxidoreductase [Chloroflexota bacterium]